MKHPGQDILPKVIPAFQEAIASCDFSRLAEIRFRVGRPLMLYLTDGKFLFCGKKGETSAACEGLFVTSRELSLQLAAFCRGSVYAYESDLGNGFVTLPGGHRVGVSGRAVKKGETVVSLRDVSGMNLRIAREFPGCADALMPYILSGNRVHSTLIIAPPGAGKTTVLRDAARQLSAHHRVTVVDERSELAAMEQGVPSFDIGLQTDVLDGFPKCIGIRNALRSLSPQVIVTDEIGTEEDKRAICELLKSGAAILASMHGFSLTETATQKRDLLSLFDCVLMLSGTKERREVSLWQRE
ncbi:MAG: stage III sporulation protein AA [Clostridia bacterium]|nr:stage III sporulation protein AA [Clostridia bacterium]